METGIGSSYDFYFIALQDIVPSSNGTYMVAELKVGGSYQTGDYRYKIFGGYGNGSMAVAGSTSTSNIAVNLYSETPTGAGFQGSLWFSGPTNTNAYKKLFVNFTQFSAKL